MTERSSTIALSFEFLVLVAPLVVLFLIALPFPFIQLQVFWRVPMSASDVEFMWPHAVSPFLFCAATISFGSGLFLLLGRLRHGRRWLPSVSCAYWRWLWLGYVLIGAAWFSLLTPPSEEYGSLWAFREDLERFAIASPLVITALHLYYERGVASGAN